MKTYLKLTIALLVAVTSILNFTSCVEDKLPDPPRLFTPVLNSTVSGTWVKVTWEKYQGTTSYNIAIYDDSIAQTPMQSATIQETEYTFENLDYNTEYFVRIQGFGNAISSKIVQGIIKTNKLPTKMTVPTSSDYLDTEIRVKWTELDYDSLRVFAGKTLIKTIILTAEDNAKKEVIISGLNPSITYTVKCYAGNAYLGEQDYKTAASQKFVGDVIDMRIYEPAEAYSMLKQSFFDDLDIQYPAGYTVVLQGGVHYEFPTVYLGTNTIITSSLSFDGRAVIDFKGGLGVKPAFSGGKVVLENLIVSDHADAIKTSDNFGGKYLLDLRSTTAATLVDSIIIRNCDVRYKRGFCRAQSAITVNNIVIDNCVIDSMGGYGITNADHAQAYLNNIVVKNSTIAHCEKVFVATKPDVSPNSLKVENVTFCYAPKGTNYIIDFNAQAVPGGITVKNSVFGLGWDTGEIHGNRSATTAITFDNNFLVADVKWRVVAATGDPQYPIEAETLSDTNAQLFASPANLNFKVTNSKIVNKAGDPRWW
ncbi:MAG: DUF5123 domain-containing protein [Paludibacter sp.]|jgi:hypothetical protein|nr:DUF5123 domain-containing protein [Paludibacter sp.]